MCRLLLVKSKTEFPISMHLEKFSYITENSREYQGHGWGCAYLNKDIWKTYKNINPIWEENLNQFGNTTYLLAHARSAFRDEGIAIENNMPFQSNSTFFIFNGELHGVKIKEKGRIGAEKLFNYILRFFNKDKNEGFQKGLEIIEKRTNYIKAMNIIMIDNEQIYLASVHNENHDYFTMSKKETNNELMICSEPFPNETDWEKILNNTKRILEK
jgi:predicted glutamine amidotransferase